MANEALEPVPDNVDGRGDWAGRAGAVAAHRELTRYEDESEPLGQASKPGQVEAYASWHAAWQALGRPTADRAEAEMSTGQHRSASPPTNGRRSGRRRTWQTNSQQPADHGGTPKRRHPAHRQGRDDCRPGSAGPATPEAGDATALAQALEGRAPELATADTARGQSYAHAAETRAAGERVTTELATRDDPALDGQPVAAEEWLAARRASDKVEDPYREVAYEHEIIDIQEQRDRTLRIATRTGCQRARRRTRTGHPNRRRRAEHIA